MFLLSINTVPKLVSYSRLISVSNVDFPEPVFPKIANVFPFFTSKEIFFKALQFVSSYSNETLSNFMLPSIVVLLVAVFLISGSSFKN
jgi:hypothetical protein